MVIPDSVKSIEYVTFYGCSSLKSVTIPSSVKQIEDYAFYQLRDLNIHISDIAAWCDVDIIHSVNNNNGSSFWITHLYLNDEEISDLIIPDGVDSIKDNTFYRCTSLRSVMIPNSVKSVGKSSFEECYNLESLIIGNSVSNINFEAFAYCYSLTSITCEATTPPVCNGDCFYLVDKSIPLYIPELSVDAYKKANEWKDFTNINNSTIVVSDTIIPIRWVADGNFDTTVYYEFASQVLCPKIPISHVQNRKFIGWVTDSTYNSDFVPGLVDVNNIIASKPMTCYALFASNNRWLKKNHSQWGICSKDLEMFFLHIDSLDNFIDNGVWDYYYKGAKRYMLVGTDMDLNVIVVDKNGRVLCWSKNKDGYYVFYDADVRVIQSEDDFLINPWANDIIHVEYATNENYWSAFMTDSVTITSQYDNNTEKYWLCASKYDGSFKYEDIWTYYEAEGTDEYYNIMHSYCGYLRNGTGNSPWDNSPWECVIADSDDKKLGYNRFLYNIYINVYTNYSVSMHESDSKPPIVTQDCKSIPYSESFTGTSQEDFIIEDITRNKVSSVWNLDNSNNHYGMIASGAVGTTCYANESWLISPCFEIPIYGTTVLSFDHTARYFSDASSQMSVWASTDYNEDSAQNANWTKLTIPNYPSGTNWQFVNSGEIDLSQYAGQNVTIAFKYVSSTSSAPKWEIKNFKIINQTAESVESTTADILNAQKIIKDGSLYIIHTDGTIYNAQGVLVK